MAIWIWWFSILLLVTTSKFFIKIYLEWSEKGIPDMDGLLLFLFRSLGQLSCSAACGNFHFWTRLAHRIAPNRSQMPERKQSAVQHAGGHSILITVDFWRRWAWVDLVLGSGRMQFPALFLSNQRDQRLIHFQFLSKNHFWIWGFSGVSTLSISVSWSKIQFINLTQYEWKQPQIILLNFWAVHRGFQRANGNSDFWIPSKKTCWILGENSRGFFQRK